jgi:hypothetical protein
LVWEVADRTLDREAKLRVGSLSVPRPLALCDAKTVRR